MADDSTWRDRWDPEELAEVVGEISSGLAVVNGQYTYAGILADAERAILELHEENERTRTALHRIAAWDDQATRLGSFDEPGSVSIAREALNNVDPEGRRHAPL